MSRKTIMFIGAAVGALLTVLQAFFGISLDPMLIVAGIGAFLTYIFFEGKLDLKLIKSQPGKWKDPKFWLTLGSGLLVAVESTFNLGIPVETIVSFITAIVGILFGVKFKQGSEAY